MGKRSLRPFQRACVVFSVLALISFSAEAKPRRSGIKSSVEGITIPNTHIVAEWKGRALRGGAPIYTKELKELKSYGITDVLIFKHEVDGEVQDEIKRLLELGFDPNRITHIPFRWREMESFQVACEQTIRALRKIRTVLSKQNRKIFSHCTVGEDRTGHLSGLLRLLLNENLDTNDVFFNEMCENGYERGNPHKPDWVTYAIYREVSYLFFRLAYKIHRGQLSMSDLDYETCKKDPRKTKDFWEFMETIKQRRCDRSSKYPEEK